MSYLLSNSDYNIIHLDNIEVNTKENKILSYGYETYKKMLKEHNIRHKF